MKILVIGGGHNGLVAAATLAGKGHRVMVLERRDVSGGVANGLLPDTETPPPAVVRAPALPPPLSPLQHPPPVFVPSRPRSRPLFHLPP